MKKPLINQNQRFEMSRNTYYASGLKLHLAWMHFSREIERAFKQLFKL